MIQMKVSMTYEWKVLGFPDIIVVDSREYDPVKEGQAVVTTYLKLLRPHMHKAYPIKLETYGMSISSGVRLGAGDEYIPGFSKVSRTDSLLRRYTASRSKWKEVLILHCHWNRQRRG